MKSAFDATDPPSMDGLRACVHCGICLPQCPTYRVLEEEMDSPRGRLYLMRAAAEGRTELTPQLAHHLDLCLGCRACETACPSGVPFGQLLEATRGQLERAGVRAPGAERGVLRLLLALFPRPDRLRVMLRALRLYQRTGLQAAVRGLDLLSPFKRLRALESLLPSLPDGGRATVPEITPARGPRKGRVGLLTGCVQSVFFPQVNAETVRLLSAAGWEVVAPREQGQASGAATAVREIAVVLGIAVLASVFAAHGDLGSPARLVAGVVPALWLGAALAGAGVLAALALPRADGVPLVRVAGPGDHAAIRKEIGRAHV